MIERLTTKIKIWEKLTVIKIGEEKWIQKSQIFFEMLKVWNEKTSNETLN